MRPPRVKEVLWGLGERNTAALKTRPPLHRVGDVGQAPKAACGAPKAQGLRNVANPVIIRLGSSALSGSSISSFQRDSAMVKRKRESKAEPCAEYGWRRNQLISGRVLPAPRSLMRYCEGKGSKEDGTNLD
jgi:hypothetical protein